MTELKVAYDLSDFAHIPAVRNLVAGKIALDQLPTMDEVKTLATWTNELRDKVGRPASEFEGPQKRDRSAAMTEVAYLAAELGWTDQQIATVLYDVDERWGKYKTRYNREKLLVDIVNRARQKVGYNPVEADMTRWLAQNTAPKLDGEQLVWGFQDFVEADFKIEWIYENLLPRGGLGLVTGFPGTGKTTWAIGMGAHLATGAPDYLIWDNVSGAKKSLFLSLEMGPAPLNHFMSKITSSYADKRNLNKNFLVLPWGKPIFLDQPEGQAFLDKLLNDHMPDLLIIDSLQKVLSKELTDEQAIKDFMAYLAVVRSKYNCSMLMVHHNRKKPNDAQKKGGVEQSDVYGSTYIVAEADFVLSLRTEDEHTLQVDTLKNRLGLAHEPFKITRDNDTLGFSTDMGRIYEQFGEGRRAPTL
jgi:hypothetical protein